MTKSFNPLKLSEKVIVAAAKAALVENLRIGGGPRMWDQQKMEYVNVDIDTYWDKAMRDESKEQMCKEALAALTEGIKAWL